jgi:hypothetical protein
VNHHRPGDPTPETSGLFVLNPKPDAQPVASRHRRSEVSEKIRKYAK